MNKLFPIVLALLFFGCKIEIEPLQKKIFLQKYEELSPEGRYENYKVYILDSVEKWVKDRDNKFYNEENVIYWYENPDKKGNKPMDKFPPIIYQEIKNLGHQDIYLSEDDNKIPRLIKDIYNAGDVIITMGAGNIFKQNKKIFKEITC